MLVRSILVPADVDPDEPALALSVQGIQEALHADVVESHAVDQGVMSGETE
jgi:hypothetical protein